ncbi:hypothetical protein K1719_022127 [Acacia pycnantha]|nr:hypothetical protein K1719_022127 [Acacia pycnantha]
MKPIHPLSCTDVVCRKISFSSLPESLDLVGNSFARVCYLLSSPFLSVEIRSGKIQNEYCHYVPVRVPDIPGPNTPDCNPSLPPANSPEANVSHSDGPLAEERTAELITRIQPNPPSEERRNAILDYVQGLIMKCFPCRSGSYAHKVTYFVSIPQVFTFGSVPLKTYLHDRDIDLTAFGKNQNLKDTWAHRDGCFSSDSDIFLFGARTVYRDICLGDGSYVVCYEMEDIERKLGFGKDSLVCACQGCERVVRSQKVCQC